MLLDRVLAAYGPETKDAREQLRRAVAAGIEMFWPEEKNVGSGMTGFERANAMEMIQAKLRELTAATDSQRQLLSQAEQISGDILQARWLLITQAQSALPLPFLVVLLFWLSMLHLSFGLFAPRNADRDHRAAHQRVVSVGRDLYYPGNEPPAARHDQSFQRTNAQGP